MTIKQYEINRDGETILDLPVNKRYLSIQCKNNRIYLYVLTDNSYTVETKFISVSLEEEFTAPTIEYVGACGNQYFIRHIFEIR